MVLIKWTLFQEYSNQSLTSFLWKAENLAWPRNQSIWFHGPILIISGKVLRCWRGNLCAPWMGAKAAHKPREVHPIPWGVSLAHDGNSNCVTPYGPWQKGCPLELCRVHCPYPKAVAIAWTLGLNTLEAECQMSSLYPSPSTYIHFLSSVDSNIHFWLIIYE